MADLIQIRRDTAANWTSANPTLAQGELGVETDTDKIKVGDGSTAWSSLGYIIDTGDYLVSSDIGSTVQGYDATIVVDADIGVSVQAYDADTAKTDVAQTYTAQQTFGELKETVFTLGTSGSIALDPANGSIQVSTLTGDPTFTDSLEAGQTLILMLNGGDSNTVTFPTVTWVGPEGNTAPTLTANDTLVFWKVSTTLYAANVGSYA